MKLGNFELDTIYTGDARALAEEIPDESIDLIFTDPVYQNIDDYRWLAETAARVLKINGNLLAFQWNAFLPETFVAMNSEIVNFQWMISLYIPNRTKDTRCKVGFNKWTPCLWFTKGNGISPRTSDIMQCNAFQSVYGNGKSNHEWSKSPEFIAHYIERLSRPDGIVCDPFSGGGTVPAMAKILGRHYLAFELDPATADKARQRVHNTQPPLFVTAPTQNVLL